MNKQFWLFAPLSLLLLVGCEVGPESGKGFTLPEGDASVGQALFSEFECNACHVLAGDDSIQQPENAQLSIPLGGKVTRIETYGELVTSVINPSHKLSRRLPEEAVSEEGGSRMKNYNDVMTVAQLIHIVEFLQQQYELEIYVPTMYPVYPLMRP